MLTDTSFWIDLAQERERRQIGPAHQFLARHRTAQFKVSIITWGELACGVNSPAELDHLLRRVRIVYLHLQIAWEAGRIEYELSKHGERLGENDNWIAATARASGLRLITRDTAFRRVRNLHLVSY